MSVTAVPKTEITGNAKSGGRLTPEQKLKRLQEQEQKATEKRKRMEAQIAKAEKKKEERLALELGRVCIKAGLDSKDKLAQILNNPPGKV